MAAAVLSVALQGLFPAGVAAAQMGEGGDPALLYPAEAASLARAAPKRIAEFAAGRLCARRALAEFGIADFPIVAAPDRQPIWPDTLVGSITHTHGLCVAVVAERRRFLGLGIDCEVVARMEPGVCERICTPEESEWIASLPPSQQTAAAVLIFSAKEAFYKCQYPLVAEWLNFRDLCIDVEWRPPLERSQSDDTGQRAGDTALRTDDTATFIVRPTRPIALAHRVPMPVQGRYCFHRQFVAAGVGLPVLQ